MPRKQRRPNGEQMRHNEFASRLQTKAVELLSLNELNISLFRGEKKADILMYVHL
jgi:hypothetical protein